jgi:hypothetical protein
MNMLGKLKARFPRLFPALTAAVLLGTSGGFAVHQYLEQSCCKVGASCCYPGSSCCHGAHAVAQK